MGYAHMKKNPNAQLYFKGHLLEEEAGEQNVEMKVQNENSANLAGEVGIDGSGEDKQLVLRQLLFHLRRLFLWSWLEKVESVDKARVREPEKAKERNILKSLFLSLSLNAIKVFTSK